jgi:hypothetical protein
MTPAWWGWPGRQATPRFAWDSYRRLIQMFGKTVLGIDGERFEHALDETKRAKGASDDLDLDASDLEKLVEAYKGIVREGSIFLRILENSWPRPSGRCSRRGTPTARCCTDGRSASRRI